MRAAIDRRSSNPIGKKNNKTSTAEQQNLPLLPLQSESLPELPLSSLESEL